MSEINREDELRSAWNFSKDFWQFTKKYYFPPADPAEEQFWHELCKDAVALAGKYGNHRFCTTQINAFVGYLEAKHEEQKAARANSPSAEAGA